ncbi:MAG: TonB-dependent receptor [Bryobacterales bacterium]|nr:TonB-dependent receptor [Bryobacterales bacterium]
MHFLVWFALGAVLALAQEKVVTSITVTATRGLPEPAAETAPPVIVRERNALVERPLPTLGHALEEAAPGILNQQSTAGQVSPFLRGLTGYQVVNLIDGVRFNNSTFRSGPNQYLVYVEPSQASRIEAMLGPSGAQYGSDALGGAINIITPASREGTHGEAMAFGGSADWSGGGNAQVSTGNARYWLLGGVAARKHNDLRAGGGWDSRNVFHRLFGLNGSQIQSLIGNRQQDSGFSQTGFNGKISVRPTASQTLSLWYQRGDLYHVRGYKDLLGGLGRVQSTFDPQALDFLYGRWEKVRTGPLDTLSATVSLNQQTDGGARQGLRATDAVTVDWNRVRAAGYAVQGSAHWSTRWTALFGGELYDEDVASTRSGNARPLYPNGSQYRTGGLFAQSNLELLPSRLRLGLGGRWTRVSYRSAGADQAFGDLTYNASLTYQLTSAVALVALSGRGFRAPNLNDLGSLGLNDLGFEIPARDAPTALLANSAGENATSLGRPLAPLRAESLLSYEGGVRVHTNRVYARVHAFNAGLRDPIVRRTLLFAATQAPAELAGLAVRPIPPTSAQAAQGVLTVATALDPRAVKAFVNDGEARYYGVESMLRVRLNERWSAQSAYTFMVGRDLYPNRPIRRLPPQLGSASLRYMTQRRLWVEGALSAAGAQRRLSGGDLDDERIGASRRRQDIADFFAGARVAPYLDPAGRFTPTGETLRQIQDRVLPGVADTVRVPLYTSTAGWVSLAVRAGVPLTERVTLHLALENLADRQYRLHGSGVDAPGRNAYLALRYLW